MTRKEAAGVIKFEKACVLRQDTPRCNRDCKKCDLLLPTEDVLTAYDMAIKALEQEPCEDTISRQAAIDALQGNMGEQKEALDMAIEALSKPTVSGWIPVAERTPEDEGPYLVYGDFPDNGYLIAYAKRILNWKKTNFFIAPFWNSPSEVIHAQAWCKLPSPYRAERSNS